jgi:hypothetical protein
LFEFEKERVMSSLLKRKSGLYTFLFISVIFTFVIFAFSPEKVKESVIVSEQVAGDKVHASILDLAEGMQYRNSAYMTETDTKDIAPWNNIKIGDVEYLDRTEILADEVLAAAEGHFTLIPFGTNGDFLVFDPVAMGRYNIEWKNVYNAEDIEPYNMSVQIIYKKTGP